ncbi:hypothetical protein [Actinomadura sp. 7K507]|uniref:hypothetical protein n=1 Tax=Actinomadura sp. 7K507 TaxID=2530365 RepID=UPI001046D44C|nr:hypothetical protein [Actinomadura sp. 7K507]TDC88256.1 hypothetical protein E1285_18565 [Actinomadura sp. 7K507]
MAGSEWEAAMRYGVVRALAGGVVALGASALLGGCGTLSSGPAPVCTDTKEALQQYMTQVRGASASDPAPWGQATEKLAGRLDELADEADGDLKKVLEAEAGRLRAAAPAVGTGDVAQLDTVMKQLPARIGDACD